MDMKEMKAFTILYEECSLRKAASVLYITPQGLSRVLKGIEEELCTQLFLRTAQGLQPTETGELFYQQAKEILKQYDHMLRSIDNIKRNDQALSIVCGYGAMEALPYSRLLEFQKIHPEMEIRWHEYPDAEAGRLLDKGSFDLALLPYGNATLGEGYADIPLFQKSVVAIVYDGHPFWNRDSLYLRDLAGERILMEGPDFYMNRRFREQCAQQNFIPDIAIETGDISFLHHLVSLKEGVGISVEFVSSRMEGRGIRMIPILDAEGWPVSLVYSNRQVPGRHAKVFRDYLIQSFGCATEQPMEA